MVISNVLESKVRQDSTSNGVLWWWWWWCWSAGTLFCMGFECMRLAAAVRSPTGALGWFTEWNPETTLPLLVLFALPLLVVLRRRMYGAVRISVVPVGVSSDIASESSQWRRLFLPAIVLFVVSFCASLSIGMRPILIPDVLNPATIAFCKLPPAYHDEFSYLLQARTFLTGRICWPANDVQPELFHQVHVLNVPNTASRYFPWTGIWIAPFESLGSAIVGHWLAGAIACVFFFLALAKLMPRRAAFSGGLLIAVSPGIAVFSNLLLAHHPTMMALSIFLWAFLRMMRDLNVRDASIAGIALCLAMLGRPMTAAGFALPFGCWMLARLLNPGAAETVRQRVLLAIAIGVPLILGAGILLFMNHAITGNWTTTAYQLYTDYWTPRHRYGFDNAVRGAALARESNVMDAYDRWATNLTPSEAMANVARRLKFSVLWIVGIVPVLVGLLMAVPLNWQGSSATGFRLLWSSVISLHMVHVPYWYDGILHWHYVFETAPLLLLLCGSGLTNAIAPVSRVVGPRLAIVWMHALVLSALLPGWIDADALWGRSKISMAVDEQSFSRVRMYHFRQLTNSPELQRPSLILVDESSADPQISYIINPPDLDAEVLVCRRPTAAAGFSALQQAFADRAFYTFDPQSFELKPLATGNADAARTFPR